jgi:N-acetylneuraminate synthase
MTNLPLLRRIASAGRPVLLSSGMSSFGELDDAVREIPGPKAIFQCSSRYPCPPAAWGLNVIAELRARYGCPVGLSDHSATVHAGVAATALGAELLEVHVVFDRRCFGPDASASLTVDELAELARGARLVHEALRHPVDKDRAADELSAMKGLFEKSVVLLRDAPAGHRVARSDIGFKKPGTGLPARSFERVVGRRLRRPVAADTPLTEEDLDVA